ncbi:MAG: hypothetical protein QM483_10300 [Desulfuromusa sp.]
MEPIRFADILFIFLTLVITFTILWFVNKAKRKQRGSTEVIQPEPDTGDEKEGSS